jgi:hypothetical protein
MPSAAERPALIKRLLAWIAGFFGGAVGLRPLKPKPLLPFEFEQATFEAPLASVGFEAVSGRCWDLAARLRAVAALNVPKPVHTSRCRERLSYGASRPRKAQASQLRVSMPKSMITARRATNVVELSDILRGPKRSGITAVKRAA